MASEEDAMAADDEIGNLSWSGPIGLGIFLTGVGVLLAGLGVLLWSLT